MESYRLVDIVPGMSHTFSACVTGEMMTQFKSSTGDINPLHTDDGFAKHYGYPSCVVYGMLTASYYSTLVGVYLPGRYALLQGVDASFIAPVFPNDILHIHGEVVSVHHALRQIEIRAYIKNQHGLKVSRAKIRAGCSE